MAQRVQGRLLLQLSTQTCAHKWSAESPRTATVALLAGAQSGCWKLSFRLAGTPFLASIENNLHYQRRECVQAGRQTDRQAFTDLADDYRGRPSRPLLNPHMCKLVQTFECCRRLVRVAPSTRLFRRLSDLALAPLPFCPANCR